MYGVRMHIETKQIITLREFAEKRTLIVFIICGYSTMVVFQSSKLAVSVTWVCKKTTSLARKLYLASGIHKDWLSLHLQHASVSITRVTALVALSLLNGSRVMSTNFACGASRTPLMARARSGAGG